MRKPLIHTHCHLICCVYIKGRVSIHIVWCWRCWNRLIQEIKAMSKVSKIDQIHLRAVMLFMSEMSEIVIILNMHKIWWYGCKALSLSFPKLFFGLKIHWILRKLWAKTSLTTTMQQCYSCLMLETLEMWNIPIKDQGQHCTKQCYSCRRSSNYIVYHNSNYSN